MSETKEINLPLSDEAISQLNAGDMVYLTGEILTGRDAAHKRLFEMINNNEALPPGFELDGKAIFYAGPCPAKPGEVIGSVGPTTSGRMDAYSPLLIERGLKVMIGKGYRSAAVIEALVKYSGIYFVAVGGAAALMARCVKSADVIAFPELGTEAVRRLTVERMPVIVAIDSRGRNFYEEGKERFRNGMVCSYGRGASCKIKVSMK